MVIYVESPKEYTDIRMNLERTMNQLQLKTENVVTKNILYKGSIRVLSLRNINKRKHLMEKIIKLY